MESSIGPGFKIYTKITGLNFFTNYRLISSRDHLRVSDELKKLLLIDTGKEMKTAISLRTWLLVVAPGLF